MPELTSAEINRKLDELLDGQGRTNDHLGRLNGRVGKVEQWQAIRTDREQQSDQSGSKAATARQIYIALAAVFVGFAGLVITLILGAHGVA